MGKSPGAGGGQPSVQWHGNGINSNYDYVTIGYSSGGVPLWTSRYNGPGNGQDQAAAIAVDSRGSVFVTGSSWNGTNYDFATIKYVAVPPTPIFAQQLGNQLVLSWTNELFNLQTAPTLSDTFTNIPGAMSPCTNIIIGAQRFFRLISK
ncbi:MAG TPA: SBBP repeat-containing protein [Candidatus Binatia bacterium]|nr:SBBP repeat-containing protein [Candidatus Binatia bacterium]